MKNLEKAKKVFTIGRKLEIEKPFGKNKIDEVRTVRELEDSLLINESIKVRGGTEAISSENIENNPNATIEISQYRGATYIWKVPFRNN